MANFITYIGGEKLRFMMCSLRYVTASLRGFPDFEGKAVEIWTQDTDLLAYKDAGERRFTWCKKRGDADEL